MSEKVAKTRKRRTAGETIEVPMGDGVVLTVNLVGSLLLMSAESVKAVQAIREVIAAYQDGDEFRVSVGEEVAAAEVEL